MYVFDVMIIVTPPLNESTGVFADYARIRQGQALPAFIIS